MLICDNRYYEKVGSEVKDITDEVPFEIPDSWAWCLLENFVLAVFSGKSPKYSKDPTPHKIVGQQANQWDGLDLRFVKYATEEFAENMPPYYYLQDGDVLLNTLGMASPKIVVRKTPENYLIESDNIYTLAAMQKHYSGRIDAILIDPPYNSNIDYIGYQDAGFESGYLEFMSERMQKAYPLLSEKGFMVINIDEGEVANLMLLCKKIFGAEMLSLHRWKKKNPLFDQNRVILNPHKIQTDYEYIIVCKKSSASTLKNIRQPYLDNGVWKEMEVPFPNDFDCFGTTSSAKDEIADIFGKREYFSTPKPVKLIKELLRATTDKNSIVMDFFAGSGTLGQAVKALNDEDGGTRRFILVNNRESDICRTVTKKRLECAKVKFKFLY